MATPREIRDTGARGGNDMLVVFGTNGADDVTLNAQGSGATRTGIITAGVRAGGGPDAPRFALHRGVERVEIYTLGGADHVLVQRHRRR